MANWKEDLNAYSVIGIDVGSHQTGLCRLRQGLVETHLIKLEGSLLDRMLELRKQVHRLLAATGSVDVVCVEKPYSIGMKPAKALAVASAFIEEGIRLAGLSDKVVLVAPSVWHKHIKQNVPELDLSNPNRVKGKVKKILHKALDKSVAPGISLDESDAYWIARYGYHILETNDAT